MLCPTLLCLSVYLSAPSSAPHPPNMDSMTTTTTASATATDSMSMSSSTSMSSSSTLMGMDSMAMTFFTSTSTPLYSMDWMPSTAGQYAGTCIFLIVFATIFRALVAVRVNFYQVLAKIESRRNGGLDYPSISDEKMITRPWRAKDAVLMAFLDVILSGCGYLMSVQSISLVF